MGMPGTEHAERVREQFNRQADAYAKMQVVRDERMLEFLVGVSGVTPEDTVLDVASGPGFMTMAFAARAARVVGVDITDRFLESARAEAARRGVANVTFLQGDVENLHFGPATFRIALCKFAFHHFPRPERVLAEMKRVITRDGRIVLVDMLASEDAEKAAYHNRIERLCDPSHAAALPESRFKRMFADLDLKVDFEMKGETSYALGDWLRHGGPGPEATKEIAALMRDSIEVDRSGLKVRLESDGIHFTHTGATFVLSGDA
jgi:ubiquinone/menaquinone biosynthesis C-methylase UbiE